jgi:hypothetical protein
MKTTTARAFLLVVVFWFISSVVFAQSSSCNYFCCPTDRTPVGIMMSHIHKKGEWMASYRFMNVNMKDNLSGSNKISDDLIYQNYLMTPRKTSMDMHMLMLMYGLSNKISIMAMVNYNSMSMNMAMLPGTMMNMPGMNMDPNTTSTTTRSSHFGDTKINVLYGILNSAHNHILLSAGVSLPTGSTHIKGDRESMYPNSRVPYSMQTGSGTVDLSPSATYLFERNSFTWGTQATSVIRTSYNSIGYKMGNELAVNSWLAYQWSRWTSNSIRLEGTTAGAIQGRDATVASILEPAANPTNYGGQKINAYLGLNFYFRNGILNNNRLAVEYGVPLYQYVNGIQSGIGNTLYVGWQVKF